MGSIHHCDRSAVYEKNSAGWHKQLGYILVAFKWNHKVYRNYYCFLKTAICGYKIIFRVCSYYKQSASTSRECLCVSETEVGCCTLYTRHFEWICENWRDWRYLSEARHVFHTKTRTMYLSEWMFTQEGPSEKRRKFKVPRKTVNKSCLECFFRI